MLLVVLSIAGLFSQNKLYIWNNNVVTDSMDITSDLKISFKPGKAPDTTTIPTAGLVAYYPFNNNANDESGTGNNGTLVGAAACADRFNKANSAMYFGGLGQRIEVSDTPSLDFTTAMTVSVWIYQKSVTALGYRIIEKATPGLSLTDGYLVDTYNSDQSGNCLRFCGRLEFVNEDSHYTLNAWHHLVASYGSGIVCFYLDGVPDGVKAMTPPIRTNSLKMAIGAPLSSAYQNYSFFGNLDDIRFYNRAISAAEVKALYHEGGWK